MRNVRLSLLFSCFPVFLSRCFDVYSTLAYATDHGTKLFPAKICPWRGGRLSHRWL